MGESYYGAGRSLESYFYAFLGVGLGGAIIRGGKPFRGWQGNAGEIGFMPTLPAKNGDYLGRHFDLFKLSERLARSGNEVATHADLANLLAKGDATLLAWLDEAAGGLAPMLVAAEYLLDPQATVVGGTWHDDVMAALVDRLQSRLPELRSRYMPNQSRLLMAELGPDAPGDGVGTKFRHEQPRLVGHVPRAQLRKAGLQAVDEGRHDVVVPGAADDGGLGVEEVLGGHQHRCQAPGGLVEPGQERGVALGQQVGKVGVGGDLITGARQPFGQLEQVEVPAKVVAVLRRQCRHEADLAGVALPAAERLAAADDGAAEADAKEGVEVALQRAAGAVVALAHGRRGGVVLQEDREVDALAEPLAYRHVLPAREALGVDDVVDDAFRDAQRAGEADAGELEQGG